MLDIQFYLEIHTVFQNLAIFIIQRICWMNLFALRVKCQFKNLESFNVVLKAEVQGFFCQLKTGAKFKKLYMTTIKFIVQLVKSNTGPSEELTRALWQSRDTPGQVSLQGGACENNYSEMMREIFYYTCIRFNILYVAALIDFSDSVEMCVLRNPECVLLMFCWSLEN